MAQDKPDPPRPRPFVLGGGKEALAIVVMLALSGIAPIFLPALVFLTVTFAIYWLVRASFHFGRVVGWGAVVALSLLFAGFGVAQYQALQRYEALEAHLSRYDKVIIRQHGILPTSPVDQVSFKNNVSDDILEQVIQMRELANVTHVFLDETGITDRGLRALHQLKRLEYVYIDSPLITEAAVLEFEAERPDCRVIVRNRE